MVNLPDPKKSEERLRNLVSETMWGPDHTGKGLPADPDGEEYPEDDEEDDVPEWVEKGMTAIPFADLMADGLMEAKVKFGPNVGPGYVDTDVDPSPKPGAARLRRYWTRGPGAAKIRWGVSGDFKRCVRQLRKYVGTGAPGLCNVYHHAATGFAPGKGPHAGKSAVLDRAEEIKSDMEDIEEKVSKRTSGPAPKKTRTNIVRNRNVPAARRNVNAPKIKKSPSRIARQANAQAGDGKRYVRTAAGARRFGQPIGSEISTHKVKKGDTLSQIAKRFGTSVDAIMRANPKIKDKNRIHTGDSLTVPIGKRKGKGTRDARGKFDMSQAHRASKVNGRGEPVKVLKDGEAFDEDMSPNRSPQGAKIQDFDPKTRLVHYDDGWTFDPYKGWVQPEYDNSYYNADREDSDGDGRSDSRQRREREAASRSRQRAESARRDDDGRRETDKPQPIPMTSPSGARRRDALNGYAYFEDGSIWGPNGWIKKGSKR